MRKYLAVAAALVCLLIATGAAAHVSTDTSNLDDLANAITSSNNRANINRIKAYAQAQAAATQSQEVAIQDLQARVAALEGTPPPPPAAACADSADNDGDGKVDYPADPGCSSAADTDETDPAPPPAACADGVDNDGDSKVDMADPGCSSSSDNDETDPVSPPPASGYPDASNTGVPAGTTLTAYTGPSNITAPNTVIDGKTIGCIQVSAPGTVIKNSKISCGGGYAVYIDDRTSSSTLLTVQDSEIDCQNTSGTAFSEADFTLLRVNIHGCENGLDVNQNVTIKDSYIHDLHNTSSSHTDGIQFGTGHWNGSSYVCGVGCVNNITIQHNTIFGMGDDGSFGTSAIISHSFGVDKDILIDSNLMAGGAATIYCDIGFTGQNYRVTNNAFSTRFKSTVGFYFPSSDCSDETQSGNFILETGQPLHLD